MHDDHKHHQHIPPPDPPHEKNARLFKPIHVILGAVALVYLAIVAAGVNTGRAASRSPWAFLPHLLLVGGILLVGAGILALVRQKPRRSAA